MRVIYRCLKKQIEISVLGFIILKTKIAETISQAYGTLYEEDVMSRIRGSNKTIKQCIRIAERYVSVTASVDQKKLEQVNKFLFYPDQDHAWSWEECNILISIVEKIKDKNAIIGKTDHHPGRIQDWIDLLRDCVNKKTELQVVVQP